MSNTMKTCIFIVLTLVSMSLLAETNIDATKNILFFNKDCPTVARYTNIVLNQLSKVYKDEKLTSPSERFEKLKSLKSVKQLKLIADKNSLCAGFANNTLAAIYAGIYAEHTKQSKHYAKKAKNILFKFAKDGNASATIFICSLFNIEKNQLSICMDALDDKSGKYTRKDKENFAEKMILYYARTAYKNDSYHHALILKIARICDKYKEHLPSSPVNYAILCQKLNQLLLLNYVYGMNGYAVDFKKAYYWLQKNNPKQDKSGFSQFVLGYMYGTGNLVKKNLETALYWYSLALHNNKTADISPISSAMILHDMALNVYLDQGNLIKAFNAFTVAAKKGIQSSYVSVSAHVSKW